MGQGGPGHPSQKGLEEFLVRPGVTQYFLMPIRFKEKGPAYADVDFTLRDSTQQMLWCTMRLSYFGLPLPQNTDSLFLAMPNGGLVYLPSKVMFTEKANRKTKTRIEASLPPQLASAFISNPKKGFRFKTGSVLHVFVPSAKALERLKKLQLAALPTQ